MPYVFTSEDFNKFSDDIIKAGGDQATLTTLLADMGTTVTEAIAKAVTDAEQVATVTAENERLKKANMDLFLRVGSQATTPTNDNQHEDGEEPMDTSTYMRQYFNALDAADKK